VIESGKQCSPRLKSEVVWDAESKSCHVDDLVTVYINYVLDCVVQTQIVFHWRPRLVVVVV